MRIVTAYSTKKAISEAVDEVKQKIGAMDVRMVVFFASSIYDPAPLSRAMADAFPKAVAFGCSTAGEIVTGRMLKESVAVMAFSPEAVADVAVGVMTGIKDGRTAENVSNIFTTFESHYGEKMSNLDFSTHVGLILIDGLSGAEEKVMDRIGDLTNVLFVGGSAGDDLKFECTHVYANGEAYTDAAVLAVLKPTVGFDIIKTQSFRATGKRFVATEVDEAKREVISFNGQTGCSSLRRSVGNHGGRCTKSLHEPSRGSSFR